MSHHARDCKLAVYNKNVDQIMTFKNLGANITNNRNLKEELQTRAAIFSDMTA